MIFQIFVTVYLLVNCTTNTYTKSSRTKRRFIKWTPGTSSAGTARSSPPARRSTTAASCCGTLCRLRDSKFIYFQYVLVEPSQANIPTIPTSLLTYMSNESLSRRVKQHNATQCDTMRHNATQCGTTQHNATQCDTMRHNATQCNTMQHNATQCNTMQHNATQCDTMQHNATQCGTQIGLLLIYIVAQQHATWRDTKINVRVNRP
jgi:hypothetical protein